MVKYRPDCSELLQSKMFGSSSVSMVTNVKNWRQPSQAKCVWRRKKIGRTFSQFQMQDQLATILFQWGYIFFLLLPPWPPHMVKSRKNTHARTHYLSIVKSTLMSSGETKNDGNGRSWRMRKSYKFALLLLYASNQILFSAITLSVLLEIRLCIKRSYS